MPGVRARGFTLVELLVVIMVMTIIASLLLVMVSRIRRNASVAATRADLQAIAMALEQYKSDFGTYPMNTTKNFPRPFRLAPALFGPEDKALDGHDGLGFRLLPIDPSGNEQGKIYQPYLATGKFKVIPVGGQWMILDRWDNPIQYYPRRFRVGAQVTMPLVGQVVNGPPNAQFLYDAGDGFIPPLTLQAALGDIQVPVPPNYLPQDNLIGSGETITFDGPFILATPGPDQEWTDLSGIPVSEHPKYLKRLQDSDDVYNFQQ